MIRLCMYKLQQHLFFQACDIGYYGRGCQQKCSIFCKISHDCNPVSGHCNMGCKNGWKGHECLESKGFFKSIFHIIHHQNYCVLLSITPFFNYFNLHSFLQVVLPYIYFFNEIKICKVISFKKTVFSRREPKVQVRFSDHLLSVRPSVRPCVKFSHF